MSIPLQQLDRAKVAVEIDLPGRRLHLTGKGEYEVRDAGNRLNIQIDDPEAPFAVVLEENSWTGQIVVDPDGTYRLRLGPP